MEKQNALLRKLPKVDDVMRQIAEETKDVPAAIVKRAVKEQIDQWRNRILAGEIDQISIDCILSDIRKQWKRDAMFNLKGVINATGVILHTNLGRAWMSTEAAMQIISVATGYSNLEYQLESGKRGSRYSHVENLLTQLTGAEAALVVNNNAAAVLLVLDTLTKGNEVIVSRGELVEIGGAFRVPAVMERSGCIMVEVGTTNKTHPCDYSDNIGENTGALLKVHTSNYRVIGYSDEVKLPELADIAHSNNLPVICDLGSGLLIPLDEYGIHSSEPTVTKCVPYADILCFSGDKLLGGPQAGIILGHKQYIDRMKNNHLLRALRIDKLTLAALEYTLRQYLQPEKVTQSIPTLQMISASKKQLEEKQKMLLSLLKMRQSIFFEPIEVESQVGGGSMPDVSLPSLAISIFSDKVSTDKLELKLRSNTPPIIARVMRDRVILDMRTIDYDELPIVASCLNSL